MCSFPCLNIYINRPVDFYQGHFYQGHFLPIMFWGAFLPGHFYRGAFLPWALFPQFKKLVPPRGPLYFQAPLYLPIAPSICQSSLILPVAPYICQIPLIELSPPNFYLPRLPPPPPPPHTHTHTHIK